MIAATAELALEAYRRMVRIRRFEERCLDLTKDGTIAGSAHLCGGQEAIPVGARLALAEGDRVVATYRGHGWAIEWGLPVVDLLAEICHRAGGLNGGRAGSALMMAPERGFLGENSIVGAGVTIAAGAALAAKRKGDGRVVVVSIGDGAMNQGATHEGFNFAAALRLPLIVVCENNAWSEMTPIRETTAIPDLAARAAAYGIPGLVVDGNDPRAVFAAVRAAADRARAGEGPTLLECKTVRLMAHYNRDVEHYRSNEERAADRARDPIERLRGLLGADGVDEARLERIDRELAAEIDAATTIVRSMSAPDAATARDHVYAPDRVARPASTMAEPKELTYAMAVNEALGLELAERAEMIVYGEDVGYAGGIFGVTRRLQATFGKERVFDTPISESAILGSAVGAAIEGLRPVVEIMWADFLLVALDSLINQAANVRYVTRGKQGLPLVVRTQQGSTPGSCAQHSQCLEALLAHIPGLRVGLPATPADAYAMLRAAIASDDPVVLIESRALYPGKGLVAVGEPVEAIGGARLRRDGGDIAVITWGTALPAVLEAAEAVSSEGVEAAVLDLRWLSPLDDAAIDAIVADCGGRVLIVHEANLSGGFGAEVAARIGERHFGRLRGPVERLATPDVRIPASPVLRAALLPSAGSIAAALRRISAS